MDDLYIVYITYDTKYGHMYTTSRQMSNGRQQTYSVTNIENIQEEKEENNILFIPIKMMRQRCV